MTLKDGTVIPCGLVVWSTGLAPRFFTRGLDLPKNERGQVSDAQFRAAVIGKLIGNHSVDLSQIELLVTPAHEQKVPSTLNSDFIKPSLFGSGLTFH